MPIARVTNLSVGPLPLRTMYAAIPVGESVDVFRSPAQLTDWADLHEAIAGGKATLAILPTAAEIASDFVPYPGLTPVAPTDVSVSLVTTNAVPTLLFQKTIDPSSTVTFRATIITTRGPTAIIVGKFIREFTVKRLGAFPAVLLQDLVPSLDYQEDPGLAVVAGVNVNNATLTVTGLAGTLTWHGRVAIVS